MSETSKKCNIVSFLLNFCKKNYWDWVLDHIYLFLPAQKLVADFLQTFIEFPPRQKAASFTIDQVLEKLQSGAGSR